MKSKAWLALLLLASLVPVLGMKALLVPLAPVAAAAPGGFDTARAMARLERVLGDERPHPVDSAANDGVRDRLVAELRALGLQPRISDDFTCNGSLPSQTVSCARIRNVVATLGPTQGRHVLLVAHYDSTPTGPGAADDGVGVATMLELAALLASQPLQRPVTLLFNEGEETGLIGARAFLERDPLAGRVDTLVNLESRGTTGPAIMFETDRPNGRAIRHYAGSVSRPAANSMTADFSRLIPNSTDVAVFKERPWTILNFSMIGNETRYHSPDDRLANLDPRSLQHMGIQALEVTRALTSGRPAPAAGELIYTDLLGLTLVTLPLWLGLVLLGALTLGFAILTWRRRGGTLRGAGALLLAMIDAGLSVFLLHTLIGWLRPGEYWRASPEWLSLAVDLTAIASAAAALLWLSRGVPRERLRLAYWLVFLLLGAAICTIAPGAAIYFLLPPLFAAIGLLWPRLERAATGLALLALLLTWLPLLHLSQVLLDLDTAWIFAPVSALILFPLLIELQPAFARLGRGRTAAAIAVIAALFWLPPAFAPAYSQERKQRLSVEYAWDAAAGKAQLLAYHDRGPLPEPFTAAGNVRRGVDVPWSGYKRWAVDVSGPAITPPALEGIGERSVGADRLVTFRLRTHGSDVVRLVGAEGVRFLAVRAGGSTRRYGEKGEAVLRCHGRSCDGMVFELLIAGQAPAEATVIGSRSGLPREAAAAARGRAATAQPQYVPDSSLAVDRIKL
ncbi:MAG TPA: M20/M25/M40 family metallo-hydrolase [Allosphingosinicella sp.]|nr:M20/M25/M40 family metallo-hydrolase [Allosphingosinicella sp.]